MRTSRLGEATERQILEAWFAIRDHGLASESRLGRKLRESPRALGVYHRQIAAQLRLMVVESKRSGDPVDMSLAGIQAWQRRREQVVAERKALTKAARDLERAARTATQRAARERRDAAKYEEAVERMRRDAARPRLPTRTGAPADVPGSVTGPICPHGVERHSCQYCQRHRR